MNTNTNTKHKLFFYISLLIAIAYGCVYFPCQIGISPFYITDRFPTLDWIVLAVTVALPLVLGIGAALLSGKFKWFALPLYPLVIALSLF